MGIFVRRVWAGLAGVPDRCGGFQERALSTPVLESGVDGDCSAVDGEATMATGSGNSKSSGRSRKELRNGSSTSGAPSSRKRKREEFPDYEIVDPDEIEGGPDVMLDVPVVKVEEIDVEVEDLRSRGLGSSRTSRPRQAQRRRRRPARQRRAQYPGGRGAGVAEGATRQRLADPRPGVDTPWTATRSFSRASARPSRMSAKAEDALSLERARRPRTSAKAPSRRSATSGRAPVRRPRGSDRVPVRPPRESARAAHRHCRASVAAPSRSPVAEEATEDGNPNQEAHHGR